MNNHHLNLYRFFNESPNVDFIENNLSRALAITLTQDSLFLHEFIKFIVDDGDYRYLFQSANKEVDYNVNIQIDTYKIDRELYKSVYAIAMTADSNLEMDDFLNQISNNSQLNITDIFISIRDIAILIEVKRTHEDCKRQLYNQILPFINENTNNRYKIQAKRFSWPEVIQVMEKVKNIHQFIDNSCVFIDHFLEFSETRYPNWFEPKPYDLISFSPDHGSVNYVNMEKRMKQAIVGVQQISGSDYQMLHYYDRLGMSLPFAWASELLFEFHRYDNLKPESDFVGFYMWPGNTKHQGQFIYNKPLDWLNNDSMLIDGNKYQMEITYHLKFSHIQGKHISSFNYYSNDVQKVLHTKENYYNQSGKWDRDRWPEFEKLMYEHFNAHFNWKEKCGWESNFINSGKQYLFMSLGFEVVVLIPYHKFQSIDKTSDDVSKVSELLVSVARSFQSLIQ